MDTKYGMKIETQDDRGLPELSMILETCSRITDNIAAGRPAFDGCDDASLTELIAQAQVEQFERDPEWLGEQDRPDISGFFDEMRKQFVESSPF